MQWSLRWNANRCRLLTWYRTFLIPRMQQLFFWSLSRFSWGSRYNCALRSTHICVSQKLLPSPLRSYLAKYAHSTQRISLGLSMTCDKIWVLAPATLHSGRRLQYLEISVFVLYSIQTTDVVELFCRLTYVSDSVFESDLFILKRFLDLYFLPKYLIGTGPPP